MRNYKNSQGGFIKTVLIIIITIVILVYFEEDIKKFLESDQAKEIIKKIVSIGQYLWDHYLKGPVMWFWDKVIIDILWEKIIKTALIYLNNLKQ